MELQFWHDRWNASEIGFHEDDVNPLLQRHWPGKKLKPNTRVLVPLCGRSHDLAWLADRCHEVIGIEVSEMAVQTFFDELGVQPQVRRGPAFATYRYDNIRILAGDFFAATKADVGDIGALYDRAALVALPPAMRVQYAAGIAGLVAPSARMLLIALEYPEGAISAPPFAVDALEIASLYGNWCRVTAIERAPTQIKGITGIEACYELTVNGHLP